MVKKSSTGSTGEDPIFNNTSEAMDFTKEDVEANRNGEITPKQEARLKGIGKGIAGCSTQMTIGISGFLAIVAAIMLYVFYANKSTRKLIFDNPANLVILLIAFAAPAIIFLSVHLRNRRRSGQFGNAKLLVAQGTAKVKHRRSTHHAYYFYEVKLGGKVFKFTDDYGRFFKDGATYSIYYVKVGPYEPILSIDEMD